MSKRIPFFILIASDKTPEIFRSTIPNPDPNVGDVGLFAKSGEVKKAGNLYFVKVGDKPTVVMKKIGLHNNGTPVNIPSQGYDSSAPDKSWHLYAVLPKSAKHFKVGVWAYKSLHKLKRTAKNGATKHHIAGPWTAKHLKELLPPLWAEKVFGPQGKRRIPWVIFGDDEKKQYEIDYRPTNTDVDDDVEPDENDFF